MKKLLSLVLAAVILAGMLCACGAKDSDSDLAYVQKKGTLVVGITDYAPMDYKDENGEWTGFDAEFARAFGEKLGVEVVFQEIQWSSKFFELDAKTIDCIWNGMTISDEVLLNTSCSDPYVKNAQVVVMSADKVTDYADAASMADLLFAVEEGSAGEAALTDNGLSNYTPVEDQATALMEVAAGTADACVIDLTMADAMTGEGTSYANMAKGIELTSEEYGVGFRMESDMTAKFNEVMAELMNDGTLDALAEKYQLTLVKGA